jgi:hypothetical protein
MSFFYLGDDSTSPYLLPHLAPGLRRYSTTALRVGGAFEFFMLPPSSFVANNETLQSGWDHAIPSLPFFQTPIFLILQMLEAST